MRHSRKVRLVGSRHSFSTLVSTPDTLLSLADLPVAVEVSADGRTASVPGAATYGAVTAALNEQGVALPALASLPHISVAGAVRHRHPRLGGRRAAAGGARSPRSSSCRRTASWSRCAAATRTSTPAW